MSAYNGRGPLEGIRVVELAGLGPGPFAAMFLAELGADVVRVDRPGGNGWFTGMENKDLLNRGKRSVLVDLRREGGPATVLELVARADVLIEGYRPGVMERLGLGPDDCAAVNPGLVYGRMTGWGQHGPLAQTAGHDIDYIAVTGLLDAIGTRGGAPTVPLNVAGDFGGGGVYLVVGILAALLERGSSGKGQVVDAAIVDGAAHLLNGIHAMMTVGAWTGSRGENLLDGGAPFYRVYATADGGHMAVGALEPKFYAALLDVLGLDLDPAHQNDPSTWPAMERALAARFAERTLEEWREPFAGSDACVAPVATLRSAPADPHVAARGSVVEVDGVVQAAPAPRFGRTPTRLGAGPPVPGADTDAVLADWAITVPNAACASGALPTSATAPALERNTSMTHNLSADRLALRDELLAERELSIEDFWAKAETRLDWPLEKGINLAHEYCDRWASDRARIALSVHEPDGSVRRWTFDELRRASSAVANVFALQGLRRGDRIAAVLDQQVEAYVVALAAWRAGMVYVPLFVGFGVDALAQRIDDAECAAIVVGHKYREVVTGVQGKLGDDAQVFTVAGLDGSGVLDGDLDLWGEVATVSHEHEIVVTAPDDVATIIFTSGTTGDPKGCLHPHGALVLGLQSFLRHTMALTREDVVFAGANPGWSFGLYTAGLGVQSLGVSRVIYTGAFDPEAWLRVMEAERVTYVATAPSAYRPLITHLSTTGRTLPDSIRGALSAGEPLTTAITDGWSDVGGGRLQDGYGSSEMGMVLANLAFDEREVPPGALSSPVPGFDVGIVDDKGRPTEGEGMIGVRDMRWPIGGYKGLEEKWAAKTVDGVFLSGDLARRDENGFFWFAGRSDDLIVTAGYNVGPSEVENIISELPGVLDVAVVAAPDPDRGSVVRAVIVEDGSVPQEQIAGAAQETVRARLGRHAYPKIVDFVSALPRTETGKVRRNVLRETGRR